MVDAQSGVALRLRAHRQPVLIADDKPSPDPRDKARMEDRSLNGRRVAHRIPSQNTGRDDRHPESPKKKPGDPSQSKDTQDDRNKERAEMKSSPRAPKAAESSTSRGKSRKKMPDDSGPDHHEPDPSDRNPEHQKPEPGDDRPDH